jgi:transposase
MTQPLSHDLRSRVIAAIDGGLSCRQAAARFGIAASTAIKWAQRWRASGTLRPRPQGGDKRSGRIEAHAKEILALVARKVDITLAEIAEHLAARHGERFVASTIWRCLDRHDQTLKKNGARQRAGAIRRRRAARGMARRAVGT